MPEKIIETKKLPSGCTAIALEAEADTSALEIGSGCIFLSVEDIYQFTRLLKSADKHFLRKK